MQKENSRIKQSSQKLLRKAVYYNYKNCQKWFESNELLLDVNHLLTMQIILPR